MEKYISLILLLSWSFFSGCQQENGLPVQNGDLLFVGLPVNYTIGDTTGMSSAIAAATGDEDSLNYIHVAIIEVDGHDSIWIIDATLKHGVDRYPFSTFLADFTLDDGSYPQLDVMRLKDNRHAADYVEQAKKFCGQPYDICFLPDNGALYCSELVRNAYRNADGTYLFGEEPMNFKSADGTFPPYWVYLFDSIGQPIPQDVPGTNPNGMSKEPCLTKVLTLEQPDKLGEK